MKITKSVFGKDWQELEKFNKLDLDERSIVFYSESSVILYPYAEELINELEKRDQKICYVTSSKDDPIFKNENKNIKSFYIGEGAARTMFFMEFVLCTLAENSGKSAKMHYFMVVPTGPKALLGTLYPLCRPP